MPAPNAGIQPHLREAIMDRSVLIGLAAFLATILLIVTRASAILA